MSSNTRQLGIMFRRELPPEQLTAFAGAADAGHLCIRTLDGDLRQIVFRRDACMVASGSQFSSGHTAAGLPSNTRLAKAST